jgi:outer membrane protein OmpA-like peptidoglycan-associated protein
LPTLEVDAHGLLLDATFVGLTGNISFFEDKGNLSGFEPKMKAALDLATSWGYAKNRYGFAQPGLDYKKIAELAGIKYEAPKMTGRVVAEGTNLFPDSQLDERTILSFVIQFKANQEDFSIDTYGADFDRALKTASTFGNAVVVIRGHSDPTKTLVDLLKAGMDKGIVTREGAPGAYTYKLNGKPLDLARTSDLVGLIKEGSFDGSSAASPRETMTAALNLSLARAEAVKKTLVTYAKDKKINLDVTQVIPTGAGISQPIVARPKNVADAEKNMRVEFRIVRVDAESLRPSDFDY